MPRTRNKALLNFLPLEVIADLGLIQSIALTSNLNNPIRYLAVSLTFFSSVYFWMQFLYSIFLIIYAKYFYKFLHFQIISFYFYFLKTTTRHSAVNYKLFSSVYIEIFVLPVRRWRIIYWHEAWYCITFHNTFFLLTKDFIS